MRRGLLCALALSIATPTTIAVVTAAPQAAEAGSCLSMTSRAKRPDGSQYTWCFSAAARAHTIQRKHFGGRIGKTEYSIGQSMARNSRPANDGNWVYRRTYVCWQISNGSGPKPLWAFTIRMAVNPWDGQVLTMFIEDPQGHGRGMDSNNFNGWKEKCRTQGGKVGT